MTRKTAMLGAIAIALIGVVLWFALAERGRSAVGRFIDPADQTLVARGKPVYDQHCAACHGARLEGQPNWRNRLPNGRLPAPPHDVSGHTWHHPDAVLLDIVRHGLAPGRTAPAGYQSDMPAYKDVLSDDDIIAVLAYIKSSWPSEALAAQKEITMRQAAH